MRADVLGGVKKYVLLTKGTGLRKVEKGERRRKLVRGNTITDEIYQVNALLVEGKLVKEEEANQPTQ
jgi:small subunit ribosomal protein S6e